MTELEVITGNVLGMKARASNRYTRNAGQEVRERFNYDISVIMKMITNGEEGWDAQRDGDEVLPRAIACWKIALEGEDRDVRSAKALERQGRSLRVDQKPVLSWKYVCAAVLLDELMRFKSALLRRL